MKLNSSSSWIKYWRKIWRGNNSWNGRIFHFKSKAWILAYLQCICGSFQHRWVQHDSFQTWTAKSYWFCWYYPYEQKEKKWAVKPTTNHIFSLVSAEALGKAVKADIIKTRLAILLMNIHKTFLCPVVHVEHGLFVIAGPNSTLIYDHAVPWTLSVQLCIVEERRSPTVNSKRGCRLKSVVLLLHLYSHRCWADFYLSFSFLWLAREYFG